MNRTKIEQEPVGQPAGEPLTAEELAEVEARAAVPDSGGVPEPGPPAEPETVTAVWQTSFWSQKVGHREELALTDTVKLAAQSGKLLLLGADGRRLEFTPAPKPRRPARAMSPRVRPGGGAG